MAGPDPKPECSEGALEIERVAALVADGTKIDWDSLEQRSSLSPDELRSLQVIEFLARSPDLPGSSSGTEEGTLPLETGFDLLEEIGRGSFGRVYRAVDRALGREVALKVLDEKAVFSPSMRERFLKEARILASLDHQNIVRVYSIDEEGGRLRLSLERIEGITLEQLVRASGPLAPKKAARHAIELCKALSRIHEQGLVHGDVKPANVMRAQSGRTVLLDFGLAHFVGPPSLLKGPITGTPRGMAPEQFEGQAAVPESDQFSLGVVLYFLLCGEYPFRASTVDGLREQVIKNRVIPLSSRAPAELEAIVMRCLARNRQDRFPSIASLKAALESFARGADDSSGSIDSRRPLVEESDSSVPRLAWIALAGMVVLASILVWSLLRFGMEQPMNVSLQTLYLLCAAVGGTILVIQTVMLLVGMGDSHGDGFDSSDAHDAGIGHDATHAGDAAGDLFVKVLTFKTVVAFLTFFGLAGMGSLSSGVSRVPSLTIAILAGGAALLIVAYLMAGLSKLQSKGNLDLRNAVGSLAKVYLRIPAHREGQGKVTVLVQGRKVECKAVTSGPEIPTGAEVKVVALSSTDSLEVLPVSSFAKD